MSKFGLNSDEYVKVRASDANIQEAFQTEVERLLKSQGFDSMNDPMNILFGVALENLADNYLRGDRNAKFYKNLKKF